jgi:PBSX family phage portal protein
MGKRNKQNESKPLMDLVVKTMGFVEKATGATPTSNKLDLFTNQYGGNDGIIQPPYDPATLAKLVEMSDILRPCIEAMATNVDGFGWQLVQPGHLKGKDDGKSKVAQDEHERLRRLFKYPNARQNFVDLRCELRDDLETDGNGYMEVVRDAIGEIAELHRAPSATMRVTIPDKTYTAYDQAILDQDGKYIKIPRRTRFRRYVQIAANGFDKVYFKQFGDPRVISSKTGKELGEDVDLGEVATEIIAFARPVSYSIYGVPPWVGNIMGVLGSRKAEEVNYLYFDNKGIPPMVVLVSGGSLTDESFKKVNQVLNKEIKGIQNFYKTLVIEAVPHTVGELEEKATPVRIEIKPLTQFMQKDALFGNYRDKITKAVMTAFRMAGIFIARSDDYTRATATEATRVMEEQVFDPKRRAFDGVINRTLLADMEINFWEYESLGAKTSDDVAIVEAMGKVKETLPVAWFMEAVAAMRNVPVGDIPEEYHEMTLGALIASQTAVPEPTEADLDKLVKFRERLKKSLEEAIS